MKAIIFDFDGVIGLSEQPRFELLQKIFADKGIILPDTGFARMVGRTSKDFLADLELVGLTTEIKKTVYDSYRKQFRSNISNHIKPNIPVVRFIKNNHGDIPFAIASSAELEVITKMLKLFGIQQYFQIITSKDETMYRKPHPEPYLVTAEKLGLHPGECIVIEDSVVGVQSALDAGMKAYVILNGVNKKEDFLEHALDGFLTTESDLHKLFSK